VNVTLLVADSLDAVSGIAIVSLVGLKPGEMSASKTRLPARGIHFAVTNSEAKHLSFRFSQLIAHVFFSNSGHHESSSCQHNRTVANRGVRDERDAIALARHWQRLRHAHIKFVINRAKQHNRRKAQRALNAAKCRYAHTLAITAHDSMKRFSRYDSLACDCAHGTNLFART
jgi:hypothetical protein